MPVDIPLNILPRTGVIPKMKGKLVSVVLLLLYLFCCLLPVLAQEPAAGAEADSSLAADSAGKKKESYLRRLFLGSEDPVSSKKFDLSFAVVPSYSREAGFGIGGILTGLYRLSRKDSLLSPSDITLTANVSLKGVYSIRAAGNNYFKGNRSRLTYEVFFFNEPLSFWGIRYNTTAVNPTIHYTRQDIRVNTNYIYRIAGNFYLGGVFDLTYKNISKIDNSTYLEGQKRSYLNTGAGVALQYDSRDFIPNPGRGVYLLLQEVVYPQVTGNYHRTLFRTTVIADFYRRVWKGGLLALDLYGRFNPKDTPWTLREELGGSRRMRGYYSGRYIDSNILSGQLELRQHLWNRLGCALFVGGGSVAPTIGAFRLSRLLPTYGAGLRWEFKSNLNLRVDYGIGKGTSGFAVNIGEAF